MPRGIRPPRSLTARLILGVALCTTVLVLIGGFVLTSVFRSAVERSYDARLGVLIESLVAVTDVSAGELKLTRPIPDPQFERPLSGWYWQVDIPGESTMRSRSLWDETLDGLTSHEPHFSIVGPDDAELRVAVRQISFPGLAQPARYIVAGPLEEVRQDSRRFQAITITSLGLLGGLLLVVLLSLIRRSLRPLNDVRGELAQIRLGEAERLTGAYPEEITPLAGEVNALMEANASIVERARTNVGNLAHALKTPLAVLANESDRLSEPTRGTVDDQISNMRQTIDHALARARAAAVAAVST
ncbi:MAG: sensor histidine kinase, partial [Gammaproteobacteria bacterium]|nr:sensor histidine kinase [Gammaproteobacteria bacterium]